MLLFFSACTAPKSSSKSKLDPPTAVTVERGGSGPDLAGSLNPAGLAVTWQAVPHASGYTVQWDTDPDFSTSTENNGQAPQTAAASGGKTTTHYIDGLTKDTKYYVRIKTNGGGSYTGSDYTASSEPAAAAIRMFAPKNFRLTLDATGRDITATWEAAEGATSGYSLERDKVEGFDSSAYVPKDLAQITDTTTLLFGTRYYFRLKTKPRSDMSGFVASFAQVKSQSTQLATPAGVAMITALSSTPQIRLSWIAVRSATSYTVQWGTDANFNNPQNEEKEPGGERTSFDLEGLTAGETYHARVQAQADGFPPSDYSAVVSKVAVAGSVVSSGDIAFSDPSDAANSKIGMREFLLTVTLSQLSNPATMYFMVSASSSPPVWSDVENHPARIVRTFTSAKNMRKIYFSLTDQYRRKAPTEVTRVDLAGISKNEEEAKSRRQAPGIMLPSSDYYVHAYSNSTHIKTSASITTKGYPASLPVQYSNTQNPSPTPKYSDYALNMLFVTSTPLEIGRQDIAYIPFRYLSIIDQTSPQNAVLVCPGGTDGSLKIETRPTSGGLFNAIFPFKLGGIPKIDAFFKASPSVFVGSPQLRVIPAGNKNQVLDAMVKIKIDENTEYQLYTYCVDSLSQSVITGIPTYNLSYVDD